jgi:inhibitor of KinA sporulation pathway (predicted exonuclease)
MEIIEIGAVLVDENLKLIDEFSTFVKPTINPTLTHFCTKLTTITQKDVDDAPYIEEALDSLRAFARQNGFYTFVSWVALIIDKLNVRLRLKGLIML